MSKEDCCEGECGVNGGKPCYESITEAEHVLPAVQIGRLDLIEDNRREIEEFFEPEFFHLKDVLIMGARKYGNKNWLRPNGSKSSRKDMHDSMFHHLAESYAGFSVDKESGLHPLLHLACRALMEYTIQKRKIRNDSI